MSENCGVTEQEEFVESIQDVHTHSCSKKKLLDVAFSPVDSSAQDLPYNNYYTFQRHPLHAKIILVATLTF